MRSQRPISSGSSVELEQHDAAAGRHLADEARRSRAWRRRRRRASGRRAGTPSAPISSHLPMTIFCWLPPESSLARLADERALMRRRAIWRLARSRAAVWLNQASGPVPRAECDMAEIEQDALVEHQAVAAAGRPAPCRRRGARPAVGLARQAAAVGKRDLAGAGLLRAEQHGEQGRRRRSLRARRGRRLHRRRR